MPKDGLRKRFEPMKNCKLKPYYAWEMKLLCEHIQCRSCAIGISKVTFTQFFPQLLQQYNCIDLMGSEIWCCWMLHARLMWWCFLCMDCLWMGITRRFVLLKQMDGKRIEPDPITYNILINWFLQRLKCK